MAEYNWPVLSASVTTGPVQFTKNSVTTGVSQDTSTPANSVPLPIINLNTAGNETGTSSVPFRVDPTGSTTQPVSAASLPLPTGASTSANQTTGNTSLSSIDTKLSSQATAANQTAEQTLIGSVTETAPGTDTASSGLNGRLQRVAQRLTSLLALLPASLGQKTMANALAVSIASDQSAVPASQSGTWTVQPGNTANTTAWLVGEVTASSSSVTSVASSATSVSLLASNASRKHATFYNDSTSVLYLKLGATASTTSYTVQLAPGAYYELPNGKIYTGAIDGIWASANGNVRITELS